MTAIEFLVKETPNMHWEDAYWADLYERAKKMEKENTDNKVIHFAEWLTKKHSYTLMALYEHFEEEFYNEEL
jgi:hypothetical protein